MKATYFYAAGAIALTFGIAACVAGPDLPPPVIAPTPTVSQPTPTPPPAPAPVAPQPVEEPRFANYLDAPQTPGTWRYADDPGETLAVYGQGDALRFIIRCDKSSRQIGLARVAENGPATPRSMTVKTETTSRSLQTEPYSSAVQLHTVELSPGDSLLDAMAITKGRIAIGVVGERTLYLPAWVEISRVIEDCR